MSNEEYTGPLQEIAIVFAPEADGPGMVFVEIESPNGYSIEVGTWEDHEPGADNDGWKKIKLRVPMDELSEKSRELVRLIH